MLEQAAPGEVVAVVSLADGADVLVFRTTPAIADWSAADPVADQVAAGADLPYGKFLTWRGMVTPEPPRRPEPQRVSSSAAWRNEDWKFGFVGSQDRTSGAVHLPPSRVSMQSAARSTTWCRSTGPTPRPPSPPTPSTAWPTRPARPSSSPSSTSTAAAGSRWS